MKVNNWLKYILKEANARNGGFLIVGNDKDLCDIDEEDLAKLKRLGLIAKGRGEVIIEGKRWRFNLTLEGVALVDKHRPQE